MADHENEDEGDHPEAEAEAPQQEWEERRTAPQSPYSTRDVGVGFAVLVVGLLVTFGVPLVLL